MHDTASAIMIGVLPFIPFFLAMAFGFFERRTDESPQRSQKLVACAAVGAALLGLALGLMILRQSAAAEAVGPAPPRVVVPEPAPKPVVNQLDGMRQPQGQSVEEQLAGLPASNADLFTSHPFSKDHRCHSF